MHQQSLQNPFKKETTVSFPAKAEESLRVLSKLQEENALLRKQVNTLQEELKARDQQLAEKEEEIKMLRKDSIQKKPSIIPTPEKGQLAPVTPPPTVRTTVITPAVKVERAVGEEQKFKPRSLLTEFKAKESPFVASDSLYNSLSTRTDSIKSGSLVSQTKISSSTSLDETLILELPTEYLYSVEEKKQIKNEIDEDFVNTIIKINPLELASVRLPIKYLPLLPMAYRYSIIDSNWQVKKHHAAKNIEIEMEIFGPDSLGKINSLTLFDTIIVQSYANTRAKDLTCQSNRKKIIQYTDSAYQVGHCIDHADTIDVDAKGEPILREAALSTHNPKNYIPEPKVWNGLRNHYVNSIRGHSGIYIQKHYFHECNPYIFQRDQMSKIDVNVIRQGDKGKINQEAYLPKGVYLSDVWQDNYYQCLDISWEYNFKSIVDDALKKKETQYLKAVKIFECPNVGYMPIPLIDKPVQELDSEIKKYSDTLATLEKERKGILKRNRNTNGID